MLYLKHIRMNNLYLCILKTYCPLCFFLKSVGLQSLYFLNSLFKWLSSVNPSSSTISLILISLCKSRLSTISSYSLRYTVAWFRWSVFEIPPKIIRGNTKMLAYRFGFYLFGIANVGLDILQDVQRLFFRVFIYLFRQEHGNVASDNNNNRVD